jgi:hypothetical protein
MMMYEFLCLLLIVLGLLIILQPALEKEVSKLDISDIIFAALLILIGTYLLAGGGRDLLSSTVPMTTGDRLLFIF